MSHELRTRPQAACIRRVSDTANGGHAEAPGSGVAQALQLPSGDKTCLNGGEIAGGNLSGMSCFVGCRTDKG